MQDGLPTCRVMHRGLRSFVYGIFLFYSRHDEQRGRSKKPSTGFSIPSRIVRGLILGVVAAIESVDVEGGVANHGSSGTIQDAQLFGITLRRRKAKQVQPAGV